jgi:hypothetical protein
MFTTSSALVGYGTALRAPIVPDPLPDVWPKFARPFQ